MTRIEHGPLDFSSMSPAIKTLIVANAVVFLLIQLVGAQFLDLFGLVPLHVVRDRWVWQPFTYLFLHATFFHLLFNLFSLWMFGMAVESQWGPGEFLRYYLVCGIGAGVCSVAMSPSSPFPIIGASGAIFGLLVAFAMLYPESVVYLYFFFPIKAKHMAVLFGLIEFFAGTANATPGVARFAHLSGMIIGYFYIRWWWIAKIKLKGWWRDVTGTQAPSPRRPSRRASPSASPFDEMAEVDRILDKILAYGEGSLTEDERDILRRQGKRPGRGERGPGGPASGQGGNA